VGTNEYLDLVSQVAAANRDETDRDLAAARRLRDQASADLNEANRRVASFEFLSLATDSPVAKGRTTLHVAMRMVLGSAPGRRMPAGEMAREINRRGLYSLRDGRPVEPQQIQARAGNYAGFDRNDRSIGLMRWRRTRRLSPWQWRPKASLSPRL
jgi:hypothetical protein